MTINERQVEVDIQDKDKEKDNDQIPNEQENLPSREELLEYLGDHLKHGETLPPHVRQSFVTYMDLELVLDLIYAILKAKS